MSGTTTKRKIRLEDFHGPNLGYVLELFDQYKQDPESVDAELREMFNGWDESPQQAASEAVPAAGGVPSADKMKKIAYAVKLADDIRTYGHLNASIYPFENPGKEFLKLKDYGLTEADLEEIPASILCADAPQDVTNGLQAITYLKEVYTKTIAFEFSHVHRFEEKYWLKKWLNQEKSSKATQTKSVFPYFAVFLKLKDLKNSFTARLSDRSGSQLKGLICLFRCLMNLSPMQFTQAHTM